MAVENNYKRLVNWIDNCLSKGKLSFTLNEIKKDFQAESDISLRRQLDRLTEKGKVVSIFKGYYLIVPPQYFSKGILPPIMFIDGLMKFLKRKYYVALINAAALNGASHQQPQEYFIVTEYPVLRATKKKGIKINYICTKQLPPEILTEKKKTESGYITVSNPALTIVDLIHYEKKIGGLNRASTVINELLENIKKSDITKELINYASVSSLQRLGFILEEKLHQKDIAEKIFANCTKAGMNFYLIPLKGSGKTNSKQVINDKWKVIVNTEIETDF